MFRPPLLRRLLDLVALFACTLGAIGMSLGAIHADHWPDRIVFASIAVALVVTIVRGARTVSKEWRSPSHAVGVLAEPRPSPRSVRRLPTSATAPTGNGLRSWWLTSMTGAALWIVYAGLQVWNWSSQRSALDRLLAAGSGQYSPPVPSPVLRLTWLAAVLAGLAVLGVAGHRYATGSGRAMAPAALASGGLLLGFVSIWLTPSRFGFTRGDFLIRPSAEFDTGVLIALCAVAAFLVLAVVLGTRATRIGSDPRAD